MEIQRFVVELRPSGGSWEGLPEPIQQARARVKALSAAGEAIRILRSVYVPEDDAWFLLVEAPNEATVEHLVEAPSGAVVSISHRLPTRSKVVS